MKKVLFILVFLGLCNWFQIWSFSKLIVGPRIKKYTVNDQWIKNVVAKKANLKLLDITIFEDKNMYGMMAGLPVYPKMIISEGMYKSFNKDELEWVILHEAAHCIFWHNLTIFLIQILTLIIGIFTIKKTNMSFPLAIIFAIFLSLICIQIFRWGFEYQADKYSIEKVDNPKGVITAQDKLMKANINIPFHSEKSILRFLLYWNIYPSKRIKMANHRME